MRRYKNVYSGVIVEVPSQISGSAWVELTAQPEPVPVIKEPKTVTRSKKRKGDTDGNNHSN